jgi:uncharacterized protein
MKYVYILQTVKNLPLGFDFTLYAYGPYDGAVLSRLSTAVRWNAVKESLETYPNGSSGYELEKGEQINSLLDREKLFLEEHSDSLDWVVKEFGHYTAARMELIGTMIYVDREAAESNEKRTVRELIERVLTVKPKFTKEDAKKIYDRLRDMGAIIAV